MTHIVHSSDAHVDTAHHDTIVGGVSKAIESNFAALDFAVQQALEKDASGFILSGDYTQTAHPSTETILHLIESLQPLLDNGVAIHLDEGNHEQYGLKFPQNNRNNTALLRSVLKLPEPIHEVSQNVKVYDYDDFQIVSVAYPFRARLKAEMGLTSNESCYEEMAAFLTSKIEEAVGLVDKPAMLSGHLTTTGFSTGGSERDLSSFFDEVVIPLDTFTELEIPYVGLGHIHTPQHIKGNTWYVGSPNKLTFTDALDHKSINYVNLEDGEVERIYTPTRGLFKADLETFEDLELTPYSAVQLSLPSGEAIPDKFRKIATDVNAIIVPNPIPVEREERESRIVLPENISPKSALQKHLKSVHCLDKERIDKLMVLATQILDEDEE